MAIADRLVALAIQPTMAGIPERRGVTLSSITLTPEETQTVLDMLEVIGRQFRSYRPEQQALLHRLVAVVDLDPHADWVAWGLTLPTSEE